MSAKERAAVALAMLGEFDIAERQKRLIGVEDVVQWIQQSCAEFKKAVLELPSQIMSLTSAQRSELDGACWRLLADLSGSAEQYTKAKLTLIDDAPLELDDSVNGNGFANEPEAS